jgi:hypothetical protein
VKSIITSVLLAAVCNFCAAADAGQVRFVDSFDVERMPFGSGTPSPAVTIGVEDAEQVVDGLYHVPNYLPGFPTAATIWPREVPIECDTDPVTRRPVCTGYRVQPAVGRGEYIFIRPMAKVVLPPPAPTVIEVACPSCKCMEPPAPLPLSLPKARKKPLG